MLDNQAFTAVAIWTLISASVTFRHLFEFDRIFGSEKVINHRFNIFSSVFFNCFVGFENNNSTMRFSSSLQAININYNVLMGCSVLSVCLYVGVCVWCCVVLCSYANVCFFFFHLQFDDKYNITMTIKIVSIMIIIILINILNNQ